MTGPAGIFPLARARVDARVVAGLGLAALIAAFAPFDRAFAAATLGVPALRAVAIVGIALAGLRLARSAGLELDGSGRGRPLATALLSAVAVAVYCAAMDRLFRPMLDPKYVDLVASVPTAGRILLFVMRAFNENILYRLFLGSLLILLVGRVWRAPGGGPAPGAYWSGFVLAQLANIWMNVSSLAPVTPLSLAHDVLRYVVPAIVWARLFWKRGFLGCEVACTSVHVFLQPLLTLTLLRS